MPALTHPLRTLARSRVAQLATWPHGVDAFASQVDPTWSASAVLARVESVRHQSPDTVTVTLAPNANWEGHRPGQHVLLTVEVGGVRRTRCFSVASAPCARALELTCKAGPDSVVARHLRTIEVGTVVGVSQAQGEFTLPGIRPPAIALVCAGSGITPLLSMLRTLDVDDHDGEVAFVQYARSRDDVLYGPEVDAIVARHHRWRATTVTELDASGELTGRFDPSHLDAAGIDPRRFRAYLCGPAPFMDVVGTAWVDLGGRSDDVHTESFGAPTPATGTGRAGGSVRFRRSGVEVVDDGRVLLLQAEAAGLRPANGCRRGICHTCVTTLTAGRVCDAVTGAVDDEAGTAVRICVSIADGDVELEL